MLRVVIRVVKATSRRHSDDAYTRTLASAQIRAEKSVLAALRRSAKRVSTTIRTVRNRPTSDVERVFYATSQLRTIQNQTLDQVETEIKHHRLVVGVAAFTLITGEEEQLFAAAGLAALLTMLIGRWRRDVRGSVERSMQRAGYAHNWEQRVEGMRTWLGGRLQRNAAEAALHGRSYDDWSRFAQDWFAPTTPGGLRYGLLLLSRREVAEVFQSVTLAEALDRPWIEKTTWRLSHSHPHVDRCDELVGTYLVEDVPKRPHPFCRCIVRPEIPTVESFERDFRRGLYDSYLGVVG